MKLFLFLVFVSVVTSSFTNCSFYKTCGTCVINHCTYVQTKDKQYKCISWNEYQNIPIRRTFRSLQRCEIVFKDSYTREKETDKNPPSPDIQTTAHLPTIQIPTTLPHTTQPPTTRPTTTEATTQLITTHFPTTQPTTTQLPTTRLPTTELSTAKLTTLPTTIQPPTTQPTTTLPTTIQPPTTKPTTTQPQTAQPTTQVSSTQATTELSSTQAPTQVSTIPLSKMNETKCAKKNRKERQRLSTPPQADAILSTKVKQAIRRFRLRKMPLTERLIKREIQRLLCRLAFVFLVYNDTWDLGSNYVKMQIYNPVMSARGISEECKKFRNIRF